MADYSSVLTRAVAGRKTYEERRLVYERARNALVNQLRSLQPPLPEADITRQRLALEEAIRKVEAEAAGAAGSEAAALPAAAPPPQAAPAQPPPAPAPPAPPPIAPAPESRPAAAADRRPAATPAEVPPREAATPPAAPGERLGDVVREAEALGNATAAAARVARGRLAAEDARQPGAVPAEPEPAAEEPSAPLRGDPALARVRSLPATSPERARPNRRPVIFAVVALLLVAAAGTAFAVLVRWPTELRVAGRAAPEQAPPPKINERMPQEAVAAAPPPSTAGSSAVAAPPAAGTAQTQSALLYEENADNPRGADTFRGSVTWRIDTEAGTQGPERVIRGLVDVSERGLKMLVTIRRNADGALPASHTVELLFDTTPNFAHGAVENVAGLRMKPSEQANGVPLIGAAARITGGYFLIGLSALAQDRERNVILLRDRGWMDVPVVYRDGRRAVLAIEKGPPGEQAFEQAFAAWR